ncbi:YqfO family protein [Teredinibacter waterburyi]|uniref:Nif3-like dinuclear metal center hexameric protein n=1 Tax=Teredinibacter waterburyi TaxID=1500538 RepID=UPI00165FB709|nr:YqfO family protein [Teredinibacter waterburyi]
MFYQLVFYVPETHLDAVKQAVFNAGAGRLGDYDACCWQVLGSGQFRPLQGSNPFIGQLGSVVQVAEYRVEMIVAEQALQQVQLALRDAHPYEQPAYSIWALANGE